MLIKTKIICAFTLLLFSTVCFAGDSALVRLNRLLSEMNTLHGKFEQIITDEEQAVVEENTGEFWLQRPGFFRWHVKPPFEKLMVSNQEKLWTYDPDLEQVTVEKVADKLMQSPMLLLSGDLDAIAAQYEVTSIADSGDANDKVTFQLVPHDADAVFEKLQMTFKHSILTDMTLHNALGEKQVYSFKNVHRNASLEKSLFEFTPPQDADILTHE